MKSDLLSENNIRKKKIENMDRLKTDDPAVREKQQKALVLPNLLSLAISIAMVVIGAQYYDDRFCRNDAPLYLLVGGGITVGMTGLKIFAWLTPCEFDDKLANFLTPLSSFANLCVLIWGSVVVFGMLLGIWKKSSIH